MRFRYALQGVLFVPVFVGLIFVLKAFCPATAGSMCFADYFATPIFLPLIAVYKIFGGTPASIGQELLFIVLYWAVVGFFVGLMVDLFSRKDAPNIASHPTPILEPVRPSIPTTPTIQTIPIISTPARAPELQPKSSTFYSSQEPMPKPPINLLDIKDKPPVGTEK